MLPCCCRKSKSPPENTSVAGLNSESSNCSPSSKGAISGPAQVSVTLMVPCVSVSDTDWRVGEQLRRVNKLGQQHKLITQQTSKVQLGPARLNMDV